MKNTKQQSLEIFISLIKDEPAPHPIRQEHELFLLSWCGEHGLGGLLAKHRGQFSADFAAFLAAANKTNVHRNLIFLQEYENLRQACQTAGLPPPVALKGLSLLQRVYSPGERALTDMDLYYPPDCTGDFTRLLENQGYRFVPEKKWRANHHKFTYSKEVAGLEVTLELHQKLFYNQPATFQPPTVQVGQVTMLAPAMEAVYLSAHLVHQHSFLKLFWLLDLHRLTKSNPDLWSDATRELAHQMRVKTSMNAVLYCLKKLFGHELTMTSRLPMRFFLNWPTLVLLNESRFKYLCIKHTSKDSLRESLAYDLRWVYFRIEKSLLTNKRDKDIAL